MNEQLRAVITAVIQKGTVLHGVSLMSPADRLRAHEEQMVANLVAAIEPVVEMEIEARVAEQGLDHPEERAFAALSNEINELKRREELARARIGVLEDTLRTEVPPGFRKPWQDDFEGLVKSIHDLRVDLIRGVTPTRCRRCGGTGLIQCLPSQNQGAAMKTCDACNGQGVVR